MHTQHTSKLSVSYYRAIIAEAEATEKQESFRFRAWASRAREAENTSEIITTMVYVFLMSFIPI
jgi:hypothetical protein